MKRYILILFVLIGYSSFAQKSEDGLRYTQNNYFSTARAASMAGAFGALGGDFYSIGINPAGLSIYRHNEASFTLGLSTIDAKQGMNTENNQRFNVSNDIKSWNPSHFGLVFTINGEEDSKNGNAGINLSFGYNQISNFDREYFGSVNGANNSFLDYTAAFANGQSVNDLDKFSDKLINQVNLIRNTNDKNEYATALGQDEKVNQYKKVEESGYQGEYQFSIASNYKRKFFYGGSIGIQVLKYTNYSLYSEETLLGSASPLDNFSYSQYLNHSGWGINAKFGAIFKPIQSLSLGLAIHTGTYYTIDETYYTTAKANYKIALDDKGTKNFIANSPYNENTFDLSNSPKIVFSGAYVFGQRGVISTDIEYINYSNSRFSVKGDEFDYQDTNSESFDTYKGAWNFRLGGEFRLNSLVSLRGGYAYQASPYESGFINEYNQKNIFTTGIGFRYENFFANLAYVYTKYNDSYVFYNYKDANSTIISSLLKQKISSNDFMLSVGINF